MKITVSQWKDAWLHKIRNCLSNRRDELVETDRDYAAQVGCDDGLIQCPR